MKMRHNFIYLKKTRSIYSLDRCVLAGNEVALRWGKLANVIEYFYTAKAPARACSIIRHLNGFKLLSEFAKVVSHVCILSFIFLEQNKDFALGTPLTLLPSEGGTKPLRLADNIDLMAVSQRQTCRCYESIDLPTHIFCMEVRIETIKDMVTTRKGTPCTGDNSGGKTLDELNNFQYIISN